VFGNLNLEAFRAESIEVAAVRETMGRIQVTYDLQNSSDAPEAAFVKLSTRDGRSFERMVLHAAGTPKRPLSDEALFDKFRECSRWALSSRQSEALLDSLRRLPDLSVGEVGRILTKRSGKQ